MIATLNTLNENINSLGESLKEDDFGGEKKIRLVWTLGKLRKKRKQPMD